jgi:hypothetical protein
MPASPMEVVGHWLQNLLDPDVVNSVVAPDATYVSLNAENPELSKIMPWAGTSHGPQAFLGNLGKIFTRWETQAFTVTTMFGSGENVAVFGDFRYKSNSLGKVVSSPLTLGQVHQAGAQAMAASIRSALVTESSLSQALMAPANPCATNCAMT